MRPQSCFGTLGMTACLTVAILLAEVAWGGQFHLRGPEPTPKRSTPTRIVYPEPSLRHATPRYEAEFPDKAFEQLRRLPEEPLPPGQENLLVGLYPMPLGSTDVRAMIDLVESTIAADTWDTVGGMGAMRAVPEANALVICQTPAVHKQIIALLKASCDADLETGGEQAAAELIRGLDGVEGTDPYGKPGLR
jgi:hypothetical protein